MVTEKDFSMPTSVNWKTYRKYSGAEQRSAKRHPIIIQPEYGAIQITGNKVDVSIIRNLEFEIDTVSTTR